MNRYTAIREYVDEMGNPVLYLMVLLNFALVMTALFAVLSQHAAVEVNQAKGLGLATNAIVALVLFDWFGKPAIVVAINQYRGESDD